MKHFLIICLLCSGITVGYAQTWPTPNPEAKAGTRWWWLGSAVDKTNLQWNLSEYARAGIGAVEITPLYGVQGNDKNNIDFLSPRWMQALKDVEDISKPLGIEVDMNCGTGWPFGGPQVSLEQAACKAIFKDLKAKHQKDDLLYRGIQEHQQLEGKQTEQQQVVNTLQKEQKTIQALIADQRKKDAALNAQIDRLIAEEVAKARARAEAEAKRKAAEEAARKRAEELARKKAAAEAAARENARRIAEAKAREAKLKEEAKAAARKSAAEKARAERAARAAEKERRNAERRAEQEAKAREKEIAEAKRSSTEVFTVSSEDRRLSGNFESNRGRLPMPITGPYRIVSHFGQYNVEGLKGVTLDNKGINLKGQAGAKARSIFDGEVSAVFGFGNTKVVMVRHGSYISVYCNLASVSVSRGQKVSTRQVLGSLTSENILQFQLRRETSKLNPEKWLGR